MYNARMTDTPSPDFATPSSDPLLPGPQAFLAAGFDAQELQKLGIFLFALFRRPPDVRILTVEQWHRSVAACLGISGAGSAPDPELPDPPSHLPRVLLIAGRPLSELYRVVNFWSAADLPRPIFAAATENNLGFSVGRLLSHLEEEHRRMTGGSTT